MGGKGGTILSNLRSNNSQTWVFASLLSGLDASVWSDAKLEVKGTGSFINPLFSSWLFDSLGKNFCWGCLFTIGLVLVRSGLGRSCRAGAGLWKKSFSDKKLSDLEIRNHLFHHNLTLCSGKLKGVWSDEWVVCWNLWCSLGSVHWGGLSYTWTHRKETFLINAWIHLKTWAAWSAVWNLDRGEEPYPPVGRIQDFLGNVLE